MNEKRKKDLSDELFGEEYDELFDELEDMVAFLSQGTKKMLVLAEQYELPKYITEYVSHIYEQYKQKYSTEEALQLTKMTLDYAIPKFNFNKHDERF